MILFTATGIRCVSSSDIICIKVARVRYIIVNRPVYNNTYPRDLHNLFAH